MAFGTDGGVYPHGDNAKQFAYMVQYGMTPMQAIQAATINAAELLGWADRRRLGRAGEVRRPDRRLRRSRSPTSGRWRTSASS